MAPSPPSTAAAAPDVPTGRPAGRPEPPQPVAPDIRALFPIDFTYTFLNHGSFGSMPHPIRAAQSEWTRELEARPIEVLGRQIRTHLAESKKALAALIGCRPEELGFVTNATEGINAVFNSMTFRPGDELLTTDHVYNAIRQAMKFTARRFGATVREAPLPLPLRSREDAVQILLDSLSSATRLVVLDHITSPTALLLPIEPLIAECRRREIPILIDGAHAPAMVPLHLDELGADFYSANLHKWLCAPKGTAFLRVSPEWRGRVHPAVISHFLDEGFEEEFDWQGTRDYSGWLSVPACIDFFRRFDLGRVMDHNHRLAVWAHQLLCERWGSEPLSPLDGSMLGSMASVVLPGRIRERFETPDAFQAELFQRHRIEAPVHDFGGRWLLRVSCQIYNLPAEYEKLADVVAAC